MARPVLGKFHFHKDADGKRHREVGPVGVATCLVCWPATASPASSASAVVKWIVTRDLKWDYGEGAHPRIVNLRIGDPLPADVDGHAALPALHRQGWICRSDEYHAPYVAGAGNLIHDGKRYGPGDLLPFGVRGWPTFSALLSQGRIRRATEEESNELSLQRQSG
jgi:hypothetical protein